MLTLYMYIYHAKKRDMVRSLTSIQSDSFDFIMSIHGNPLRGYSQAKKSWFPVTLPGPAKQCRCLSFLLPYVCYTSFYDSSIRQLLRILEQQTVKPCPKTGQSIYFLKVRLAGYALSDRVTGNQFLLAPCIY